MAAPIFINNDVAAIVAEMVADYEALVSRTLAPAQAERLLINAWAYRESLLRSAIQGAAEQSLVSFASAPMLDYLGELVGVTRLPASRAEVELTFTLPGAHLGVTILAGTRVSSVDGQAIFRTKEAQNVTAGVTTAVVLAECQTAGTAGNGYVAGSITTIIDVQAYLTSCTNVDPSGGGAEEETDDELRARIKLAPGGYSNAGSVGAYKYWALSASAALVDVGVISPGAGEVELYPLMGDGTATPSPVLDAVEVATSSERVRPLTDLVTVIAPTRTLYDIEIELTCYDTADGATVTDAVEAAVTALATLRRQKLGQDIIDTAIYAAATVDGVYEVTLVGWTNVICAATEFAVLDNLTVSITSYVVG